VCEWKRKTDEPEACAPLGAGLLVTKRVYRAETCVIESVCGLARKTVSPQACVGWQGKPLLDKRVSVVEESSEFTSVC